MKKTIISLMLIFLIGISGLVYAAMDLQSGNLSIIMEEGWNLVHGFLEPDEQILAGSEISLDNIKVVYAFIPTTQEYARVLPNEEFEKLRQVDSNELENTAVWVYSDKRGIMDYRIDTRAYTPIYDRQMYGGWNFLGITSEMLDTFVESGSCNIVKMVSWQFQEWEEITEEELTQVGMSFNKFGLADDPDDIGMGIIIKVTGNCKLGLSGISNGGIAPPQIPN